MGKVLVVEDDALLSKLYNTLISKYGHQVVVAGDGDDGLKKASTEKPDLIMLDIMMPKMNGLQVLDALRKNPATQLIPVIVLTGLSKVNEEKDVLARGATRYYDKGENDPKQVADVVNQMLSEKAQAITAAPVQTPVVSQPVPAAPATPQPMVGTAKSEV